MMLQFLFKNKDVLPKEKTMEYWKSTHNENYIEVKLNYWKKIKEFINKDYSEQDILAIEDNEQLNVLVVERLLGWKWLDEPQFYISGVDDRYLSLDVKCITTMTHWLNLEGQPFEPSNYVKEEYALEFLKLAGINNVKYSIKPMSDGYMLHACEQRKEEYRCKTFHEAVCKLALINKM